MHTEVTTHLAGCRTIKVPTAVARHCVHCGLCLPNKLSYADAGLLTFLLHLAGLLTALLLPPAEPARPRPAGQPQPPPQGLFGGDQRTPFGSRPRIVNAWTAHPVAESSCRRPRRNGTKQLDPAEAAASQPIWGHQRCCRSAHGGP